MVAQLTLSSGLPRSASARFHTATHRVGYRHRLKFRGGSKIAQCHLRASPVLYLRGVTCRSPWRLARRYRRRSRQNQHFGTDETLLQIEVYETGGAKRYRWDTRTIPALPAIPIGLFDGANCECVSLLFCRCLSSGTDAIPECTDLIRPRPCRVVDPGTQ